MTYWKEQYLRLKIQPSEPPVCMKDLKRIPMDHPKLKFGITMDAIGVYSAEIDCIQFLNDAFDIMRRNQIPWLNALIKVTIKSCNQPYDVRNNHIQISSVQKRPTIRINMKTFGSIRALVCNSILNSSIQKRSRRHDGNQQIKI